MLHRFLSLAALVFLSASLPAHAQAAEGGVRGRIVDSVTGRAVPTATVHLMRNQRVQRTVEADTAGEFSFDQVPEGVYSVEVEEPGFVKAVQADVRVVLRRVAAVEFALVRGSDEVLSEVVVSARATAGDPRATPNTVLLEREEIRRNPGSAGDVFRALGVLPGVVATGEFSSFTVRGNGPRDNLILIDGIPFDKVAHFDESFGEQEAVDGGGRYSIFAPNIIGSARFSPGGWRAAEGGRNGSLLELEIADGNPVSSTVGARVEHGGIVVGSLDRLEADYRVQREFTANAAHELRTSLATLRARLESRLSARELAPVALESEHYVTAATPDASVPAHGNATLTRLVFRNLIENAIQYTPAGTSITLSADAATVIIADDGPGIAADAAASLFERFRRGPNASGPGAGLARAS